MTLDQLKRKMPPPASPVDPGNPERWDAVEKTLGTALPEDYKAFINTYGTGYVGAFVIVYNPFSPNQYVNLVQRGKQDLEALRQVKKEWGADEVPFALFPQPGGLLPWGVTDNGDTFSWLTDGKPEDWSVVLNESRGPSFEQFAGTMTIYLASLIDGTLHSEILPQGAIDHDNLFAPIAS